MGWSGSGKTTFIESCIAILASRGYRVYAVKSTHLDIELDTPGTDSYRFQHAGARGVCLLTGNGATVFLKETEEDLDYDRMHTLFPGADFILAEGYHGTSDYRFEAVRGKHSMKDLKRPVAELNGVITDSEDLFSECTGAGIPVFTLNAPEVFVNFLTAGPENR